jgi:two-component system, response regulator YesN
VSQLMVPRSLVWVDLTTQPSNAGLCSALPEMYQVHRIGSAAEMPVAIKQFEPFAVCFEYDSPDADGLHALRHARQHLSIPVLMVTQDHSEALAVWALRTRVWNYLVQPVPMADLCICLAEIHAQYRTPSAIPEMLFASAPLTKTLSKVEVQTNKIGPALTYLKANYENKVVFGTLADLCHLSPFQFSRVFHHEMGITCREFLLQLRILHAAQMLKDSKLSVTDAGFEAGFNDLSYFARMFRRYIGVSPSDYRRGKNVGPSAAIFE